MIIKNGIVADPASGLYEQMDILVKDGKIVKIAPEAGSATMPFFIIMIILL